MQNCVCLKRKAISRSFSIEHSAKLVLMSVALLRWFVLEAFRDQQAGLSEDKAEKFVPAHPADLPVVQSSSRLLLPFCSICLCSSSLSPGDLSPSDGQERPVAPNKLPQGCLKRPKPFKPVCGRMKLFHEMHPYTYKRLLVQSCDADACPSRTVRASNHMQSC